MALLALWNPNIQFLKTDGTINAGGKIVVTDHNDADSIPSNYSDADGTTLNHSPIVLDALGRATCYIDDGSTYDLYVKDANGATLWTVTEMTPGTETIVVSGGFSVSSNDSSVAVVFSVDQNGVTNYDLSIQKEIDRATEAEKGLADAIEAEKKRAESAESALSESIADKAGTASPLMDGKASVGNSLKYAREDHVHPSDTSREAIANKTTVILGTSNDKYPTDKAVAKFVNSSIATNTANYISNNGEPFTSVEQLEAYSGTVTNNDYAFVTGTDSEGNTYYDRYKATFSGSTVTWALEYRLNNSSFTAAQWEAINSGVTSDKANYWDGKQDALTFDGTYNGSNNKAATVSSITSRINDLDAAVTSTDGTNVQVKVTQTDGKVTAVNITKDDTASKSDVNNKMDKQTAGNTSTPIYLDNGVAQEVTSIAAATADALNTPRKIDGVEFDGSSDIVHYGVCSTEYNVKVKDISCPGFVLTTGARIIIKFTKGNNFRDPSFNVNGTGEVPVRYFGSLLPTGDFLRDGAVYQFVYDGTNYCFVGNFDNNNKVYQTAQSTNAEYPIVCKNNANQTAELNYIHFASGITMNPSTNKITASGGFVGNVSGTASKAVADNSGNDIETTYATKTELSSHKNDTIVHITEAERTSWNAKQSALTFDTTPTAGSTNPVTSGGVKTAIDNVQTNIESVDSKGIVINEINGENVICFE